jgi:hypothetical protein
MATTIEQAVQIAVDGLIEEDARVLRVLSEGAGRMNHGQYEQAYLEAICQKFMGAYDIYDAFCFWRINILLVTKQLLYLRVPLGHFPLNDDRVEGNNLFLSKLPSPFKAVFWGGLLECDGKLDWSEAVEMYEADTNHPFLVRPGYDGVPLEVGRTSAQRSLFHFIESGGLARWPYGQDEIWLFVPKPGLKIEGFLTVPWPTD